MKRVQTYVLDRMATGIGSMEKLYVEIIIRGGNFHSFFFFQFETLYNKNFVMLH
jgi:hypothetical protein